MSAPASRITACVLRDRLGRGIGAEFAVRQADAQPDARFAVGREDGEQLVWVGDEGNRGGLGG